MMKKLVLITMVVFGLGFAPRPSVPVTVYSGNLITSSGTTEVELQFGDLPTNNSPSMVVYIQVASTNSGTIQFSVGRTIDGSYTAWPAGSQISMSITNGLKNLRYKASATNQKFSITHYPPVNSFLAGYWKTAGESILADTVTVTSYVNDTGTFPTIGQNKVCVIQYINLDTAFYNGDPLQGGSYRRKTKIFQGTDNLEATQEVFNKGPGFSTYSKNGWKLNGLSILHGTDYDSLTSVTNYAEVSVGGGGVGINVSSYNIISPYNWTLVAQSGGVGFGNVSPANSYQLLNGTSVNVGGLYAIGLGNQHNSSGDFATSLGENININGTADYSFTSGLGDATKRLQTSGKAAINMSMNTSAQTNGHGALADNSTIIGGIDENIPPTSTGSTITASNAGKVSSSVTYTLHSDNLRIKNNTYLGAFTATPNSTLQVGGAVAFPYVAKTANYTITASDYLIDCTANSFTVTFPTAVGIAGRIYVIRNSGAGTIALATTSSQTINGSAPGTQATTVAIKYMSTGAAWITF